MGSLVGVDDADLGTEVFDDSNPLTAMPGETVEEDNSLATCPNTDAEFGFPDGHSLSLHGSNLLTEHKSFDATERGAPEAGQLPRTTNAN